MGIRDILLAILVAVGVFLALGKPWRGVLLWVWLSVMNPHRLTYGFMWSAPVAAVAALVTLGSLVFTRDKISLPICAPILFLAGFVAWMSIGLPFSIHPDQVIPQYSKVMKIILMTFVAAAALSSRKHVHYLTWMLVLSLGFYGVKGGLFTLANGGNYMVRGPDGSFIGPNNELALALTMTVPLMRYLQLQETRRWMRNALSGAMLLTAFSILGSPMVPSRGQRGDGGGSSVVAQQPQAADAVASRRTVTDAAAVHAGRMVGADGHHQDL
ncbi:MAG: putative O-glycosylation ligase, exosortase A system-associated [Burkholderiales bacterium]|nr:putative O-glycosylation ligase, exosortase A system-associated [Burkholderiales bacterium]